MAILHTDGLGKDYGELTAVGAVDLEVDEGEIFGLLGPNGAGKTTTISMITGVITATRGRAVVAGHDIAGEPFAAKRALGLVPQELALYEEITARQNLGFFGSAYGLRGAALRERIDWVLEVVGLGGRADEPVVRFSGGMKRRLNLAAGLLHRPRFLVLDEPTVGVDPQSRNHIFETIRELQQGHGMTVLYTSHYMEEVEALCARVAIMDGGEVVAEGSVDALIAAHGGGSLEIDVDGDDDAEAAEAALADLGEVTREGVRLRVVRAEGVGYGDLVRAVEGAGVRIAELRTLDPNLETVFLTLTGHSLRDV